MVKATADNFDVVDVLREVGRSMAEVALSWVATRPGVSSVLIGASRTEQVSQNIASLDVSFASEQRDRLEQVSAPPMINPYFIFHLPSEFIFGVRSAESWETARRG